MKKISFMKFFGAGNDFIVIANADCIIDAKAISSFVVHVYRYYLLVVSYVLIFI